MVLRVALTFAEASRMFWRILYIPCLLAIAAAVLARIWLGKQVVSGKGGQPCKVDVDRWSDLLGTTVNLPTCEATAAELGHQLWKASIVQWHQRDPKAARARESAKRFGLAVPPLTIAVALFALIAHRIPIPGAIAIFLASTALSCLFGLLSIATELRAVAVLVRVLRERRAFIRRDDEDAVISCALAQVWMDALPPIVRWI
jgi:hypothetical protein